MLVGALTAGLEALFGERHLLLVVVVVDGLAFLVFGEDLGDEAAGEGLVFVVDCVGSLRVDEDVLVVVLVVEVFEHHGTSFKCFCLLLLDYLVVLLNW